MRRTALDIVSVVVVSHFGMALRTGFVGASASNPTESGTVRLPVPLLPTGPMRGRFHPVDGHLYVCGLFGWGSERTSPGGLYRIRRSTEPLRCPVEMHAVDRGVILRFSDPLDRDRATRVGSYKVQRWNYRWKERYGSDDYRVSDGKIGRERVKVRSVQVSRDARRVFLEIDDMRPSMQLRVDCGLRAADGSRLSQRVFQTVHRLGAAATHWKESDR